MKRRLIALIVLIACTFSGCFFITTEPYIFRQEYDQIVSIEILKKEYDSANPDTPMDVIKVIPPIQYQEIIDDLLKVGGCRNGLNPATGFGVYIIRITYKDGEVEMIGNYSNGYFTPDGELHEDIYTFNREGFYKVISHYLGEVIAPPTLG